MQNKLKELEKKYNIDWRNVRMGDLFEFEAIKQAKSQREIPTDNSENGVPYIVQSMFNNMFSRNVNKQWLIDHNEAPVSGNKIVLGVTLPAVSYQPVEFGASQVITAKADWLNPKIGIFITTSISKLMYQFSYGRKPGMQIYKDMKIKMPFSQNEISFDYIEEFVNMLEAERLAMLETYLLVNGLNDTELSDEECSALDKLGGAYSVNWKAFNLKKLFDSATRGRRLKSSDRIVGNLPFVTAGETNMGISGFIGNDVQVFPKNTITIDMFGSAKYRNYMYGADDHVAVIHTEKLDEFSALFTASSIHKSAHAGQFDYSRNFYATDADNLIISLPVKEDGNIDYDFMKNLMSAIQKYVIKGVVKYLDNRIEATNQIIKES
jgi:hypothetical protein